jgi:hypothetical protein
MKGARLTDKPIHRKKRSAGSPAGNVSATDASGPPRPLEVARLLRVFYKLEPQQQQLLLRIARQLSGREEEQEEEDPIALVGL